MLRPSLKANDFLVAESAAMREVGESVERFADGGAPVLVCGEHGTGRELVARVLHQRGPRARARFIAVRPTFEDVPSAPAKEREREQEGDTTCERARRALRAAAGGTLLVKDVSDLSAASQKTLRRAIRDRERDAPEVFDVQIVATADLDLERAVDAAIVSRELYELFRPRRIVVPPLRDRLDDLPALFERWIKHYAAEIGRAMPSISRRALARLAEYPWPGNVGELKSIARRLVVRVARARIDAGDVDEILPVVAARVPLEDLAFEEMVKSKLAGLLARIDGYPVHDLYDKVLARVERPLFDLVLAHTGGNQLKAAEILGLNRNTLRKKLADLGLKTKGRAGREDRALDGE
ncbi:MAG TPA: sigma 54-interacting transcriptional regulator [Kofleriaceae bacterium]|nr:sigma 54-interacting transcriptional regulator [Kofleriaceae bacterium]